MTLNAKIGVWGFYGFFGRFSVARHISRANSAETNWDRHEQAANEIFSIERRFWQSKSRFSWFKETCARRHQRAVPPVKVTTKWLEIDWQFANTNCYNFSRVSWASAQFFCFFYCDISEVCWWKNSENRWVFWQWCQQKFGFIIWMVYSMWMPTDASFAYSSIIIFVMRMIIMVSAIALQDHITLFKQCG